MPEASCINKDSRNIKQAEKKAGRKHVGYGTIIAPKLLHNKALQKVKKF